MVGQDCAKYDAKSPPNPLWTVLITKKEILAAVFLRLRAPKKSALRKKLLFPSDNLLTATKQLMGEEIGGRTALEGA